MSQKSVCLKGLFGLLLGLLPLSSALADLRLLSGPQSNPIHPVLAVVPSAREGVIYFDFLMPFLSAAGIESSSQIHQLDERTRAILITSAWNYRDAIVLAASCAASADRHGVCDQADLSSDVQQVHQTLEGISAQFQEAQTSRTTLRLAGNPVLNALGIETLECSKDLRRIDDRERNSVRENRGAGESARHWTCSVRRR